MRIPKITKIPIGADCFAPRLRSGLAMTGTHRNRSFTYLEIVAGIIIITFILFGMNAVFGVGMRSNKKAERIQRALGLAQDLMEQGISRKFSDNRTILKTFDELTGKSVVTYPSLDKKSIVVTVTGPDITDVRLYCETANLRLL